MHGMKELSLRMRMLAMLLSGVCLLASSAMGQFYQGSNLEFGKNRVQYKEYDWFYLPSDHFEVYFYVGGENLAKYTLLSAEKNLGQLEGFFDYTLDDKIQILSYLNHGEFRQSNIGIRNDDEFNIGGTARILGNKMFVFYETDHRRMNEQIRENLARVLFTQMMYGGDWKDVLKSNTLMSMPKWFEEGIISYAASGWNSDLESGIRDILLSKKFKSLNRLYGDDATLAGKAFWNYIAEVYGESVIPNILYMTRISRNVESGFLYVLGLSVESVTRDYIDYYKQRGQTAIRNEIVPGTPSMPVSAFSMKQLKKISKYLGEIPVRQKSKYVYSQFRLSPDGKYVAWVTNEMGQYKVWLHEWRTGKTRRIFKKEYKLDRLTDYTFPVLAWHPSSLILSWAYERRGQTFLASYNTDEKELNTREVFQIEKIIDMSYSDDGQKMIFSGVNRGQTDLYLYQIIGNNHERLTNDIWDDMNPRFIRNSGAIIFSSNRPDDTLRTDVPVELYPNEHDIYIFNLENRLFPLEKITSTPEAHEYLPAGYSPGHYTFLSRQREVADRFICTIDSAISRIDTTIHYRYFNVTDRLSSFPRSPVDYQVNESKDQYSLVFRKDGKYLFSKYSISADGSAVPEAPTGQSSTGQNKPVMMNNPNVTYHVDTLGGKEIDITNYVFEDERQNYQYEKESVRIQEVGAVDTLKADTVAKPFEFPRSRTYRINFATDYVLTQVDNSFTNSFYQNFSGPTSINPGISGLIKLGVSDLFEDRKIVGGFRLSGDLQSNDYGLSYENLSKRTDRKLMFQRQSQLQDFGVYRLRSYTHSVQYQIRYPIDELTSIRFTTMLRNDRLVSLSLDPPSLVSPNYNEYNLGLKVEYVFDNTISRGLNLFNGTRYKIWAERYQQP
ncbi:MAG: hypothetical protein RL220_379, partial [Bacteroidota bacterium]